MSTPYFKPACDVCGADPEYEDQAVCHGCLDTMCELHLNEKRLCETCARVDDEIDDAAYPLDRSDA